MADVLNGWEKRDKALDCMQTGDMKCISETLATVQDQKSFMHNLGSKAETVGLPGLQIVDGNKDGYPEVIKVTAGENQMTIALADGKLSVTDDSPTIRKTVGNAWDYVKETWSASKKVVGAAVDDTALGQALKDANTSKSLPNQLWNNQIKKAGG
jgi:tRNA splicing ligase